MPMFISALLTAWENCAYSRSACWEDLTAPASTLLQGSYNYGLVALSVALAIVASYATTDLAGRLISSLGIVVISATIFLVLLLAIKVVAFVGRMLALQSAAASAARCSEAQFHTLAEAIPQIVWTTGADGLTTYINQNWYCSNT